MSDYSFQFHAQNEEIFHFIREIQRVQSPLFIVATDDLRLRSYEMVLDADRIGIYENRKIFFISRKNSIIEDKGKNCLVVFCGQEDSTSMEESYMSIRGEGEEFKYWKKIAEKFKSTLLKGGTVYNPVTGVGEYYKDIYYSVNTKKAYENGVKIKPFGGWNYYILEQEN